MLNNANLSIIINNITIKATFDFRYLIVIKVESISKNIIFNLKQSMNNIVIKNIMLEYIDSKYHKLINLKEIEISTKIISFKFFKKFKLRKDKK